MLNLFHEGVAFPESVDVTNDSKLHTVLELWGAYFTEVSRNAKFLTLIMALETIAIAAPRTHLALRLQNKWIKEVEELREIYYSKFGRC